MTAARRFPSWLTRSSGFVDAICSQCSRQHIVGGFVHQSIKFRLIIEKDIGNDCTLRVSLGPVLFSEDGIQYRRDCVTFLARCACHRSPHPIDPTVLVGSVEDPAYGGAQALAVVGGNRLGARQPAV